MRHGMRLTTAALGAGGALLAVALTGCGDEPPEAERSRFALASVTTEPSEPGKLTPSPTPTPTASEDPGAAPIDISGPLVIPESDPAQWPPGPMSDLTPAQWDEAIAGWGPSAECSPFSLMIDYRAGLLSPEEYTAYAMYGLISGVQEGTWVPPGLELPERYTVCDDSADVLQVLGFAMGAFVEYIDPAFRNELWLRTQGITYDEANRPLTDEELDQAFEEFYGDDLPVP